MFEHHSAPLLPKSAFYTRLGISFFVGIGLIVISLVIGMIGYHRLEGLPWLDAFTNAAMILSGMGPLTELHTPSAKIFAGCYAIYSGFALITIIGIVLAPVVHRAFHKFHLDVD